MWAQKNGNEPRCALKLNGDLLESSAQKPHHGFVDPTTVPSIELP